MFSPSMPERSLEITHVRIELETLYIVVAQGTFRSDRWVNDGCMEMIPAKGQA